MVVVRGLNNDVNNAYGNVQELHNFKIVTGPFGCICKQENSVGN